MCDNALDGDPGDGLRLSAQPGQGDSAAEIQSRCEFCAGPELVCRDGAAVTTERALTPRLAVSMSSF